MSNEVLRAAVVGLGVGEQHIAGYRAVPGVEVVAVCDVDTVRLHSVADRYDIPGRYDDYRRITEDTSIDVVSICSWDNAHAEQAISAFRHGQHVMVEKPVALSKTSAADVLEAQQASGRLITSNLILRGSPRFRALKEAIDAGKLGDLFYLEGDYLHDILYKITEGWRGRMPGYSVIYGGGIHLIDLMRWFAGDEVEDVSAMGTNLLAQGSQFEGPDTTVALLRFRNGLLAKSTTSFGPRRPHFHNVAVHGTRGTFVNGLTHGTWYWNDEDKLGTDDWSDYPGVRKGDLLPGFIQAIRENRDPDIGAVDVFRVADVCFAAAEAVQTGRTVKVSYLL